VIDAKESIKTVDEEGIVQNVTLIPQIEANKYLKQFD